MMLASLFASKTRKAATVEGQKTRVVPEPMSPKAGTSAAGAAASPPRTLSKQLTRNKSFSHEIQKGGAGARDIKIAQAAKSKQVDELLNNMRTNTAGMRAAFADADEIRLHIHEHEKDLLAAIGTSQSSANVLKEFNEEMEGDFELMKLKPQWEASVSSFLDAALGNNADVERSTKALCEYIGQCFAEAMPSLQPSSVAVVYPHPVDNKMLEVVWASSGAELKVAANVKDLRDNSQSKAAPMVWNVLKTGEPALNNAHGIPRDKGNVSVAPLKTTVDDTFACIVTGAPPYPDELLEMMCRQAGPLLEQVWKLERVRVAIRNVMAFVKRYTMEHQQLLYCEFTEDAVIKREKDDTWDWMPFVHNPNEMSKFELQMKWSLGTPIGVLTVSCGTFTPMDEENVMLLHTMGDVLLNAITVIEGLTPGDPTPLSSVLSVLDAFETCRPECPVILQKEIAHRLEYFEAFKVFSEISHMEAKAMQADQFALLQGVLCLLGHKRKDLDKWPAVQKLYKKQKQLHDEMRDLELGIDAEGMDKRWTEFEMSTKPIDLRLVSDRGPQPVTLLVRWVQAVMCAHNIALAIEKDNEQPGPHPIADKIFDEIDRNGDGQLDLKELCGYLLSEFPTSVAHKMIRVLDSDLDKLISRDEWRRGWAAGHLNDLLRNEEKKEEGTRMRNKRASNVCALSMAMAAEEFNKRNSSAGGDSKGSKKNLKEGSGGGKKKVGK